MGELKALGRFPQSTAISADSERLETLIKKNKKAFCVCAVLAAPRLNLFTEETDLYDLLLLLLLQQQQQQQGCFLLLFLSLFIYFFSKELFRP